MAKKVKVTSNGSLDFILFMAFVGALVYFVQNSAGVGGFFLAILKAIVWPAYILHAVMESLQI